MTKDPVYESTAIINLLKKYGALEEFIEWQSYTPNWRNQIAAHHFSAARGDQGPESLRYLFRKVRNNITVAVSAWPDVAIDRREQRDGKYWVTKDEWQSLPANLREGRASKNSRTSKAKVRGFPVYVIEASGHAYC